MFQIGGARSSKFLLLNNMRQYLIFLIFLLPSCGRTRDASLVEKEQNLTGYYSSQLNKKLPENQIIVILQNQNCSACRMEVFLKLYALLRKSNMAKTFILASRDSLLMSVINRIPKSEVEIDSLHRLKDYGLNYAADLCFLVKGGRLEKWTELSNLNLENMHSLE